MKGARIASALIVAGMLASCGVNAQPVPQKIDLRAPASTPTPQVRQSSCPPTPTVAAPRPSVAATATRPPCNAAAPSPPPRRRTGTLFSG